MLDAARAAGRGGSVVEALLVRALAHHAAATPTRRSTDLGAALDAGVPAGYRRLFLDEGAPMPSPAPGGRTRRPGSRGCGTAPTAAAQPRQRRAGRRRGPAARADEALSERELEVLRLLATDLTGPEIAARLFVSVNTLRTHTKHIFTKLDVNTRRAAVRRAARARPARERHRPHRRDNHQPGHITW